MGIIGGADGPTVMFVSGSISDMLIAGGIALAAAVLVVYLWRKRQGKK